MSRHYAKTPYSCKLCGTLITDYIGHKICCGCVVDEIYETIAAGKKVTQTMVSRARYKGIDIADIRRTVEEDAKVQKQKSQS